MFSWLSARLSGLESMPAPQSTGCHCWRAVFHPERVGAGRDWFLQQMRGMQWMEFWGDDTRFGMLDTGDGNWSFYAVVRQRGRGAGSGKGASVDTWSAMSKQEQLQRLQVAFKGYRYGAVATCCSEERELN